MSTLERNSQLQHTQKDIVTIITEKTVNPQTQRPYPASMIEKVMDELHYSISTSKSAKQQVRVYFFAGRYRGDHADHYIGPGDHPPAAGEKDAAHRARPDARPNHAPSQGVQETQRKTGADAHPSGERGLRRRRVSDGERVLYRHK